MAEVSKLIFFLFISIFFFYFSIYFGAPTRTSSSYITWKDILVEDDDVKHSLTWRDGGNVIVVSKDGRGDSRTVQGAVDLIPHSNTRRIKIFILPGVYREKVLVPRYKPRVSFIAANPNSSTVISWNSKASDPSSNGLGGVVGTYDSASVAVESDYFTASHITFENTSPEAPPGSVGLQAVALRVTGDKSVFYRCRILGSQDTLFDHIGRHLFYQCYIRGNIDFIFGSARSLYKECTIHSTAKTIGAIAASQRNSSRDIGGFIFSHCRVKGSGKVYLGRAWGRFSTVIFGFCEIDGVIIPEGWNDWGDPTRRETTLFAEYSCTGGGADQSRRVPWMKTFTHRQITPFLSRRYIDNDRNHRWLRI